MKYLNLLFFILVSQYTLGQGVAINTDDSDPDGSALLDVKSTTQGVLFPRMTIAEREVIATPVEGLMIYQTNNTPGLRIFDGDTTWNLVQPAVAFVSDVKNSGTAGGAAIVGWQTRELNTTEGYTGFFPLPLGGNQFTLERGTYIIEGTVPSYVVERNQAVLYDSNSSAVALKVDGREFVGTSVNSPLNGNNYAVSELFGVINVDSQNSYQIHQYASAAYVYGLGVAVGQGPEVYTYIKITKIAD